MRLSFSYFFTLFFLLLSISSCTDSKWKVDTSSISVDLNFNRFELDLFELAKGGLTIEEINELQREYPQLYPLYVEGIMKFGERNSQETFKVLNRFTSDKDILFLMQEVKSKFPKGSLSAELKDLENGLKAFKHYFPERVIPEVKTMISAFTFNTVAADSLLVVGIDTYLGSDFSVYPQTGIPKYKFEKFSKEYLVSDAMKAWVSTEFEESGGQNLLEQMIFQGKVLYLVNAFLPSFESHLLFNYSQEELEWCKDNEEQIWFHFVDMELLYTIENHKIKKYLGDAPFITGFPEGSPGRVGQWMGFEVVTAFMKNNSNYGLKELMELKDANQILQKSKYKPSR